MLQDVGEHVMLAVDSQKQVEKAMLAIDEGAANKGDGNATVGLKTLTQKSAKVRCLNMIPSEQ